MAKRGRPPKLKEDPAITIAILQKDNRLLEQRCQELMKERDNLAYEILTHRDAGESLCDKISEMEKSYLRMEGWRDLARELLHELPLLRSNAPGV